FNLGLNLLLIPLYKQTAAAAVTSLTEMLLCTMYLARSLPRDLLPRGSLRVAVKILVAGLVMAVVAWYLRPLYILLMLPLAGGVYLGVALLIGAIPRADLAMVVGALRKKGASSTAVPELELAPTRVPWEDWSAETGPAVPGAESAAG